MRRRHLLTLLLTTAAAATGGSALHAQEAAPQGKVLYCQKDGERVHLRTMNVDGTGDKELPGQLAEVALFPTWSPDGKRFAYMTGAKLEGQEYVLAVCNADGTGQKSLPIPQKMAGLPAWSPDGKMLLFVAGEMMPEVYLADSEGAGLRKISEEGKGGMFPFWMPDGKRIGYSQFQQAEMKAELVLAKPDGTGVERLTGGDERFIIAGPQSVSRDGKRIAYLVINPMTGDGSINIWDIGAKSDTVVTELGMKMRNFGPESISTAAWAPDGTSLLVGLGTDRGIGIFRISQDGKTRSRLTPEGKDCFSPSLWSPS